MLKTWTSKYVVPFKVEITEFTLVYPLATGPAPVCTADKTGHVIAEIELIGASETLRTSVGQP